MAVKEMQLGKQGITENFIETLKTYFEKNNDVKISVLRSARSEGKQGKKQVEEYKDRLLDELGPKFTARVIGFTISIKKWRKPVRDID